MSNLIHLSMNLFPLLIQMKAYAVLIRRNYQVSKHTHRDYLVNVLCSEGGYLFFPTFLPPCFQCIFSPSLRKDVLQIQLGSSRKGRKHLRHAECACTGGWLKSAAGRCRTAMRRTSPWMGSLSPRYASHWHRAPQLQLGTCKQKKKRSHLRDPRS